jgi:excisionase family DNA binding protein
MFDTRYSVRDAAEFHRVSEKTIRRWIQQGILPAERVGPKLIRIDRTEVYLLSTPVAKDSWPKRKKAANSAAAIKKPNVARPLEPWQPSAIRGHKTDTTHY